MREIALDNHLDNHFTFLLENLGKRIKVTCRVNCNIFAYSNLIKISPTCISSTPVASLQNWGKTLFQFIFYYSFFAFACMWLLTRKSDSANCSSFLVQGMWSKIYNLNAVCVQQCFGSLSRREVKKCLLVIFNLNITFFSYQTHRALRWKAASP